MLRNTLLCRNAGFGEPGWSGFHPWPACLLLLSVVLFSTSSDIHNRMLQTGEQLWSGYYKLRMDPVAPTCDPNRNIEAAVAAEMAKAPPSDDPMAALLGAEEKNPADVRLAIERRWPTAVKRIRAFSSCRIS